MKKPWVNQVSEIHGMHHHIEEMCIMDRLISIIDLSLAEMTPSMRKMSIQNGISNRLQENH